MPRPAHLRVPGPAPSNATPRGVRTQPAPVVDDGVIQDRVLTPRFIGLCCGSLAYFLAIGIGGFLVGGVVALTDRPGGFLFCAVVSVGALLMTGPLLGSIGAGARSGTRVT